jgi:hypothetical protein
MVQATGEQEPDAGRDDVGERPVEHHARSGFVRVDEHDVDRAVAHCGERGIVGREPLDQERHAAADPANVRQWLASVQLRTRQAERVHELDDALLTLVAEHADRDDARRETVQDLADRVGLHLARAPRCEHEPEGVGSQRDREQRVFLVRDAADLHPHGSSVMTGRGYLRPCATRRTFTRAATRAGEGKRA